MKLEICKTSIGHLKGVKKLYTRAVELLQRTNQFRMNDLKTDLTESSDEDTVWLVSLKDKYGTYGVVSILLANSISNLITQWVLSCRALGRGVQERILEEIHKDASSKTNYVKFAVNKTARNTPALDFLEKVGIDTSTVNASELTTVCSDNFDRMIPSEQLHDVKTISDLNEFFQETHNPHKTLDIKLKENSNDKPSSSGSSTQTTNLDENFGKACQLLTSNTSLLELNEWILKNWGTSLQHQALFHNTFPIITYERTEIVHVRDKRQDGHTSEREAVLRASWMEVLQIDKEPNDSDNFVQSGGNSFSAVYLVSILRRLCSIEISIIAVLQSKSYADIKNIVDKAHSISVETTSIVQLEHSDRFPLSAAQQRMVLMQQTNSESSAYVETLAFRVKKVIDPNKVTSALIQRHPILKSKIIINPETLEYSRFIETMMNNDVRLEVTDCDNVSEDFLKNTTPVLSVIDSSLFQVRFITAKEDSVLVLHVHHVIVDDITLTNISNDIEKLLHNEILNKATGSDDYADYVKQETIYLTSKKRSDDEEFWEKMFTNLPPESDLAILPKTDSTSFDTKVFRANHSIQIISDQTVKEIALYCREHGLTEFQYFLSCVTLVLQRYLGVDEVTLAIPVTTRTENHESTDGLFVNTVLSKTSVDFALTFKEHNQSVAAQWLETLSHSNYPLDQIIKMLWKSHGKNSSSFCSVMFNYVVHGSKADELSVLARDAKMPLSLDVVKYQSSQTLIVAEWADELIDNGIAERLLGSVVQLCATAYKVDEKSLNEIQVLSNQERNLLKSFAVTPTYFTTSTSLPVHLQFEEFAQTTPLATAVVFNERHLTYRELDELSSKICNGLLKDVAQDRLKSKPVVIAAEKNELSIAAIFGVWKAGGHFLPVGTANISSLKNISARNTPAAILTNLPADAVQLTEEEIQDCPLLRIHDLTERSSYKCHKTRPKVSENDLAYIIQTSGSTGTPKQCKISHKSLCIIANAWKNQYAMAEFKVNVLQWAPLSFDVFVGDVVRALVRYQCFNCMVFSNFTMIMVMIKDLRINSAS